MKTTYKKHTDTEISRLDIGLRMAGLLSCKASAEHILLVQDEIKKKGGKFTLLDATKIEQYIKDKYFPKPKETK